MAEERKIQPEDIAKLSGDGPPWARGWALILSSFVAAVLALGLREIVVTWLDRSAETESARVMAENERDKAAVQGLIDALGASTMQQKSLTESLGSLTRSLEQLVEHHEKKLADLEARIQRVEAAHPNLGMGKH